MQLQRERLELNPVFSTAMQHGDHMTGYIRLVNFSQKAAPEMRHAIAALQVQRVLEGLMLCLSNFLSCLSLQNECDVILSAWEVHMPKPFYHHSLFVVIIVVTHFFDQHQSLACLQQSHLGKSTCPH